MLSQQLQNSVYRTTRLMVCYGCYYFSITFSEGKKNFTVRMACHLFLLKHIYVVLDSILYGSQISSELLPLT